MKPSSISTTGYLVLPNLKRKRGNFTLNSIIRDKFLCTFQEFRALVCHAPIAVSVANHGFLFGGPVFLCGQLPFIESPNDSGGWPQHCPLHIVMSPEGHPESLAVHLGRATGDAKKVIVSDISIGMGLEYSQTFRNLSRRHCCSQWPQAFQHPLKAVVEPNQWRPRIFQDYVAPKAHGDQNDEYTPFRVQATQKTTGVLRVIVNSVPKENPES